MRLIKRIRNAKSVLGTVDKVIESTAEIVKETTIDRDKFFQLEHDLQKIRAELLLGGPGQSVTKFTICGLVVWVVGVLSYVFLNNPDNMKHALIFSGAVSPLIGFLMGIYGTKGGKTFQKDRNGEK